MIAGRNSKNSYRPHPVRTRLTLSVITTFSNYMKTTFDESFAWLNIAAVHVNRQNKLIKF